MKRTLFFILLSPPLMAQTDSLRYDKWIGWITPTSIYHFIHPAVEVGAEYNTGNLLAYTLSYGIRSGAQKDLRYDDQSHQYIRLGFKKYFAPKFNSGYIMPELSIFHISHKGFRDITWHENDGTSLRADARIRDFYLKTGALLGRKMKAGSLRFDFFIGGGARFTFRHHKLLEIIEGTEGWTYYGHGGWNMPGDEIHIHTPKGWRSLRPIYYLSLGLRLGIGFKPVRLAVENALPGS